MLCGKGQVADLLGVFLEEGEEEGSKIIVEASSERCVVGQFRKFPVDCPYHLDIVVSDELKILLLVLFGSGSDRQQKILMQPALLILLPVGQLKMILASVPEQPYHFEQKLEQRQHEHVLAVFLHHEGLDVLDRPVAGLRVLQLATQMLPVSHHWVLLRPYLRLRTAVERGLPRGSL